MNVAAQPPESAAGEAGAQRLDAPPPAVVNLLASLHRLLKVARMYDKNNQALAGGAEAVIAATAEFCALKSASSADLMFANQTVFANGTMLQLPRDVYERAMELGALLERCDVANVNISETATTTDLVAFVHTLGNVLREPTLKAELSLPRYGGVRARPLRWRAGLEGDADESVVARVLRTYAAGVVVVRRFFAAFTPATSKLPPALRRIAQRIVSHAEGEAPLLVALAAGRNIGTDEAAISVNTALAAVLMARQLTSDRGTLTDLVLAALLHDVGRRRLTLRRGEAGSQRPLNSDEKARLPASDALVSVGLEKMSELTIPRTVVSFEAHWQAQATPGGRLGPLYEGRRPTAVLARIVTTARAFCELMAPGPQSMTSGPDDAIQFLVSRATDDNHRLYLRLLTGGLGILPAGTSVELSTGEIAVVAAVPEIAAHFGRPPVRVMYDGSGNALAEPLDVDLSKESLARGQGRSIRRVLDTDARQTQAMRAFVLSSTRGDTSKRERPPPSGEAESGKRPIEPPREAPPVEPPPPRAALPTAAVQAPPPAPSGRPVSRLDKTPRPRFVDTRAEEGADPPSTREVVSARVRTAPPIERGEQPGPTPRRERSRPPIDVVGPLSRPTTNPAAFRPAGALQRPQTNPGPLRPTALAPPGTRPRTDPRAFVEGARSERSPASDPRSESFDGHTDEPSRPGPIITEKKPAIPVTAASSAPTIARSWGAPDPQRDPAPEAAAPPAPAPRVEPAPKPEPTRPAASPRPPPATVASSAPTVARAWGDFDADAPSGELNPDDEFAPNPNATRKARWSYDKLVASSTPDAAPGAPPARPTVKVDKNEVDDLASKKPK